MNDFEDINKPRQVDPRWSRFDKEWTCVTCGQTHKGLFDLACMKPEQWSGSEEYLPNSSALTSQHCLTQDFCILDGEHYFVRCVLGFRLIGAPALDFGFGVWSTLSKQNFDKYAATFDSGDQEGLGPWFGWFSNRLKGYPDTLNLKCQVHPRAGRQRPWIELTDADHPLVREFREGLTYERLMELYALNGHKIAQM